MKSTTTLLLLFFLLCFTNLYAEWTQQQQLIYLTKPLLMTVLVIYFLGASKAFSSTFRNFIALGFLFSIGGDTLLMFVENNAEQANFFLYGLASFLITHLCYLYAFLRWPSDQQKYLEKHPWLLLFFIIFLIGNMVFLWPDIPTSMRWPVLAYSVAILSMTAACLQLYQTIPNVVFSLLFAGVLLFVLSDNLIALNKFKSHEFQLPAPRLSIMITYLTGQFLIAQGALALLAHRQRF